MAIAHVLCLCVAAVFGLAAWATEGRVRTALAIPAVVLAVGVAWSALWLSVVGAVVGWTSLTPRHRALTRWGLTIAVVVIVVSLVLLALDQITLGAPPDLSTPAERTALAPGRAGVRGW